MSNRSNSHTTPTEFFGTPGTLVLILILPVLIHFLHSCLSTPTPFNFSVILPLFIYFLTLAILSLILPGPTVLGVPLPDGRRLPYKLNALSTLTLTLTLTFLIAYFSPTTLTAIHNNLSSLFLTLTLFSYLFSLILYLNSFKSNTLATNTPSHIYNYFMGRELNPRFYEFDFKFFCELRPGLIAWVLINASFLIQDWLETGRINPSLLFVNVAQCMYVIDAMYHESAVLTTMDITTEGFGWMLVFGDLVWVPFVYSLQCKSIYVNGYRGNWWILAVAVVLHTVGYWVFRGSNSQKHTFRTTNGRDASVVHLSTITTRNGSKLLTGGWWGVSRHVNYFGDWLMGVSWSLACGFESGVSWFYVLYFGVLLVHRAWRDDEKCREKYGKDWDEYCRRVKWRIVPGVY